MRDLKLKFSLLNRKRCAYQKLKNLNAQSKSNIKTSNSTIHFLFQEIITRYPDALSRNYCEDYKYTSQTLYMLCENIFLNSCIHQGEAHTCKI